MFGYSLGENGCNKGHIHLAMRRTSNQTGLCHYVDPSPFLDTFQPVPTWRQECKEFTFKVGSWSGFLKAGSYSGLLKGGSCYSTHMHEEKIAPLLAYRLVPSHIPLKTTD